MLDTIVIDASLTHECLLQLQIVVVVQGMTYQIRFLILFWIPAINLEILDLWYSICQGSCSSSFENGSFCRKPTNESSL